MDREKSLKKEIDKIFASAHISRKIEEIAHRGFEDIPSVAFLIVRVEKKVMALPISQIEGTYHISRETVSILCKERKIEKSGKTYNLFKDSSLAESDEKYLILFETRDKEAKILICDEFLGRTRLPASFEKKGNVIFFVNLKCLN
jgi:hypothetical protein